MRANPPEKSRRVFGGRANVPVLLALAITGTVLLHGVSDLPPMGNPTNPDKTHVTPRYFENGPEVIGARNLVAGVILNYRNYDTLAEVVVIFAALCAVIALLGRHKRGVCRSIVDAAGERAGVVIRTVTRFLLPVILLFAAYTILHGKVSPGGGFQGAAVLGGSIIVFTLAFGMPESTRRITLGLRVSFESFGVLIFGAIGLLAMALGANFLTLMLPGLPGETAEPVRAVLLVLLEFGIGASGGMVFTSIVFAMLREDG